jgi:hypothetical protein
MFAREHRVRPVAVRSHATFSASRRLDCGETRRLNMGRALILWLLGIPIPILLVLWLFGFFH